MYISWPKWLSTEPSIRMIQAEGHIVMLSTQYNKTDRLFFHEVYIDNEKICELFTVLNIIDYIYHNKCIYYICTDMRKLYCVQHKTLAQSSVDIPISIPTIVDVSITMYRCNVCVVITEPTQFSVLVVYGEMMPSHYINTIQVNGKILARPNPQTYAIGITGMPRTFSCFALVSNCDITTYDSKGPYYEYKPMDTNALALQAPLWFTANEKRRHSMHMSMHNWNLMATIGHGTMKMKYSFNEKVPVAPIDWIQISVDNTLIDPADFVEISADSATTYEMKVKALRKLEDIELKMMTPLHFIRPDGSYDSIFDIPYMKQGDEITVYFTPVMELPGYTLQRIIEKLNIRIRGEVW